MKGATSMSAAQEMVGQTFLSAADILVRIFRLSEQVLRRIYQKYSLSHSQADASEYLSMTIPSV
jgi:hypothetical protein